MESSHLRGPRRESNNFAIVLPEAVLLLATENPLGGVQPGVGEGGPEVGAVAGHGVVETAPAQQPEVGHGVVDARRSHVLERVCRRAHPPAAQQVRGQGVYRLQHGETAQGGLDAPRRGGPGRVLVVGAVSVGLISYRTRGGKGRALLVLQVVRVVVVQGEAFPEVRRQFSLGVELG